MINLLAGFHKEGNGWTCISTQDGRQKLDIVDYARNIDGCRCDICNKRIARNEVFLIEKDNKIIQAGANCFMSELTEEEVDLAHNLVKSADQNSFDSWFLNTRGTGVIINKLYQMYKKIGFNKMAYGDFIDWCKINNIEIKVELNDEIEQIINYIIEKCENTRNEFKYNLATILKAKQFTRENYGILQYTFKIYDDMKVQEANKEFLNKEIYKGGEFTIKDIRFIREKETRVAYNTYAKSYRYIIVTTTGMVLELSVSNEIDIDTMIGKTYAANVKKYNWASDKKLCEECNLDATSDEGIQHYESKVYGVVTKVNRLKEVA